MTVATRLSKRSPLYPSPRPVCLRAPNQVATFPPVQRVRRAGLPCAFVRKTAKPYGTARLAEGAEIVGRDLLVVEDVATSGGQIAGSAGQLRGLGARVEHALCVIDRQEGAGPALAAQGIILHALLARADLDDAAAR